MCRGFLVPDSGDGSPVNPDSMSSAWRFLVIRSGLPHVRFHDLRHMTPATWVAMRIVVIKVHHLTGHYPPDVFAAVLVASFVVLVSAPSAQASPVKVKIVNFPFKPADVSISKGTNVVWKNGTSATTHSVTAYKGPWSKDTTVFAGSTTSFTFISMGTFKYFCRFHAHITPSGRCVANTGISTRMCGTVVAH